MRVSSFAARPGLGCVINDEAAYLVIVVALARHGRQRSHCYLVPIYILVGATNDQRHCGMALASDLLSCILTVGLYFFAVWASSKVRDCFLSLRTTRSTQTRTRGSQVDGNKVGREAGTESCKQVPPPSAGMHRPGKPE